MTSIRKFLGLLLSVAALAFAFPALADSGDLFRLTVPTSASGGAQPNFSVTITNKAGFDFLKSFTITAPPGVTLSNVVSGSSSIPASKITATSTGISVSGISIPNNQTGVLKMTATFPAAACVDTPYTWQTTAKGGFFVSNEVFTLDAAHSNLVTTVAKGCYNVTPSSSGNGSISPSTVQSVILGGTAQFTLTANAKFSIGAVTGTCGGSLAGNVFTTAAVTANCTVIANFVPNVLTISQPTSAGKGTPFPVTVGISPSGVTDLALGSDCGATSSATTSTPALVTFSVTIPAVPASGKCTLTASQTNYTPASTSPFTVFPNTSLGCGTDFNTSQGQNVPALDPDAQAFVGSGGDWGLRQGHTTVDNTCAPLNFQLTVNTDTNNSANLVYDKGALTGQNPAFKYVVIWKPVPVNPSGWETFRPQVSWGTVAHDPPVPNTTDYVPALMCTDDPDNFETLSPAALAALLPVIPADPLFAGNPNPQFQPGKTAQMCILQQGFTLMGDGTIQYWDKVLDESDGHVVGP